MTEPVSKHTPLFAGDENVSVTGTLTVDTGLVGTKTQVATLAETAIAANEESIVTISKVAKTNDQETQKLLISVFKGGTAHGTVGDSAVLVNWLALAA